MLLRNHHLSAISCPFVCLRGEHKSSFGVVGKIPLDNDLSLNEKVVRGVGAWTRALLPKLRAARETRRKNKREFPLLFSQQEIEHVVHLALEAVRHQPRSAAAWLDEKCPSFPWTSGCSWTASLLLSLNPPTPLVATISRTVRRKALPQSHITPHCGDRPGHSCEDLLRFGENSTDIFKFLYN